MAVEIDCPICDAPIPLDNNERQGDIIQCSFCKECFKLLQTKDKGLVLIEEFMTGREATVEGFVDAEQAHLLGVSLKRHDRRLEQIFVGIKTSL